MSLGVRLPHLERGLAAALSGVADVVAWARGAAPRDPGSLLSLRLLSPPTTRARYGGVVRARSTGGTVTVTGASEGERNVVTIDGYRYVRDVPGSSSITEERDALLAAIAAGEAGRLTVAANGSDGIDLTPVDVTALWELELLGELTGDVDHLGACRVDTRQQSAVLELQAFVRHVPTDGVYLADSASAVLAAAQARLSSEQRYHELAEWGVGVGEWLSDPTDISAIAGGRWETRAQALVGLNLRSTYVESVDYFEGVTVLVSEAS